MRALRDLPGERPQTVAWISAHLSASQHEDFPRLVTIVYALAGGRRFDTRYAWTRARNLLEGQHAS